MEGKQEYNHLVNFVVAINAPGLSFTSILGIICAFWRADDCIWYRSNRKEDIIKLNNTEASSVTSGLEIALDTPAIDEKLLIINPRASEELKEDMILMTKAILSNISTYDHNLLAMKSKLYHDALTGVCNNEALINRINSQSSFSNVSVAFVDVNALGIVNNTLGHEAGDLMLRVVASVIASKVRANEVYRKGGDEFIVISEGIGEEEFTKRMLAAKKQIEEYGYSASFGIAHSDYCVSIESLIEEADQRMYEEKALYKANNPSKYNVGR